MGVQTLAGVTFDVRGLVQLRSLEWDDHYPEFPVAITAIPINAKARRLHFLQGAVAGPRQPGLAIAKYVLHYADGGTRERPIVVGEDVSDWLEDPSGPAAQQLAWSGEFAKGLLDIKRLYLYKTTGDNPRPEAEIVSLDFVSEMKTSEPFLVAVTIE